MPAPEVYVIAVSVMMFSVIRLYSLICRVSLGWCASAWMPISVVYISQRDITEGKQALVVLRDTCLLR